MVPRRGQGRVGRPRGRVAKTQRFIVVFRQEPSRAWVCVSPKLKKKKHGIGEASGRTRYLNSVLVVQHSHVP